MHAHTSTPRKKDRHADIDTDRHTLAHARSNTGCMPKKLSVPDFDANKFNGIKYHFNSEFVGCPVQQTSNDRDGGIQLPALPELGN
jgi:hypothetical protein